MTLTCSYVKFLSLDNRCAPAGVVSPSARAVAEKRYSIANMTGPSLARYCNKFKTSGRRDFSIRGPAQQRHRLLCGQLAYQRASMIAGIASRCVIAEETDP